MNVSEERFVGENQFASIFTSASSIIGIAGGEAAAGINVRKGRVTNILEESVVVPLLVHTSAISLATECVRLILKIDDIVVTR